MDPDPIIAELYRQRDEQAARFGTDVEEALRDLLEAPLPEPFRSTPAAEPRDIAERGSDAA